MSTSTEEQLKQWNQWLELLSSSIPEDLPLQRVIVVGLQSEQLSPKTPLLAAIGVDDFPKLAIFPTVIMVNSKDEDLQSLVEAITSECMHSFKHRDLGPGKISRKLLRELQKYSEHELVRTI